eukprot:TRINITY_DN4788_c0_g1_i1.p1 TRINITY_DN4788_c0_g1~~TRINITY_DN4788_c0_g1_i1.p1  ORF type:complete len:273 (+),score=13.76 TRINITY_DN4788_c0_g1_i1:68-886(+)
MKRLFDFARAIVPQIELRRGASSTKRFYKDVSVVSCGGSNYEIALDSKKLKTPFGKVFTIKSEPLAHAVSIEWASQDKEVLRSQMHLTGLVNTCLDNPTHTTKENVISSILEFLKTDTILFFASEPVGLVELQESSWRPLIDWFNDNYGVSISPTNGLNIHGIPNVSSMDLLKIRKHLTSYPFEAIHGLSFGVDAVKSLVLTLAVLEKKLSVDDAIRLGRLELEYQTQHWGNVEWAHDIELHDSTSRLAASSIFVNLHVNSHTILNKNAIPL